MKNEYAKHEIDKIREYEAKGYTSCYECKEEQLIDVKTKTAYRPEDIKVVEEFRYEGMSNPADMSILYIIETNDGSKGTILAAYGPTADPALAWFFQKVPEENMKRPS